MATNEEGGVKKTDPVSDQAGAAEVRDLKTLGLAPHGADPEPTFARYGAGARSRKVVREKRNDRARGVWLTPNRPTNAARSTVSRPARAISRPVTRAAFRCNAGTRVNPSPWRW